MLLGSAGAGKTSVAAWLLGLLTQRQPAEIVVLDPHCNDIWEQMGLPTISLIENIEQATVALLAELDARYVRKRRKQPYGKPLLIVTDELLSLVERFEDPKRIKSALTRLITEGRKVDMTLIAISHSAREEDTGITAQMRSNYFLIYLCVAARRLADRLGKHFPESVAGVAYPCLVSGVVEDAIAIHPTHGGYSQWKRKGNHPQNLLPIRALPPTMPTIAKLIQRETGEPDPLPKDFPPEAYAATAERLESLLDKGGSDFTSPTPEVSEATLTAIKLALEFGKSRSWIIENILKLKGRRFNEGKGLLIEILKQIEEQA